MSWFTEQTRGWIYRVLIAAGVIAAGYGVLTSDQVAMWLGLAVAILNVMPSANTSVKPSTLDSVADTQS